MDAIADLTPLVVWDGGRRIALALDAPPAKTEFTVIAHGPMSSACVAVWEASAGLCLAILPEGTAHLDMNVEVPGREPVAILIELDSQLAPAMVDPEQTGLKRIILEGSSLSTSTAPPADAVVAFNLVSSGTGGLRIKAGPLVKADADAMITTATANLSNGVLEISFASSGGSSPVLAAFIPADPSALHSGPEDLTGASGLDAAGRGFALWRPEPTGKLHSAPLKAGDRVVIFAPRHHRIATQGADRPGTRLVLTALADNMLETSVTTHAYRPATSTAMAALSGGGLAGSTEDGRSDVVSVASAVAEAYWRRNRLGAIEPSPYLVDLRPKLLPDSGHPLARLTMAAADMADASVSPLVAAVGAALDCPPAMIEEIEGLQATERASLAAWTALAPNTASSAVQTRLILPARGDSAANAEAVQTTTAAASSRPALRDLVDRLTRQGVTPADREAVDRARALAESLGETWTPLQAIADALALLVRYPAPIDKASGVDRLLIDLKSNAVEWSNAQKEAKKLDLGAIAEKRALIPVAALASGLTAELIGELDERLTQFSAEDIILLQLHLTRAASRQALVRGVRLAIQALDEAAASSGLAARMDRSGDPLVGMTRIGSAAEPVMRELAAMPQARDALVALNGWINACVPAPEPGHALSERLVRSLKSYGCFLLMHAVAGECRTHLDPKSEGAGAFAMRLSSGLTETLVPLAAAASSRAGDDMKLGLSFTNRLPGLHGKAAP